MTYTTNKHKFRNLNTMRVMSLATLITASMFMSIAISPSQNANAAACPNAGVGGVSRCYAVDTYSVFATTQPPIKGLKGLNSVYDTAVTTGFVADSNWVMFTDGTFMEVLWKDPKDTLSGPKSPQYTCGQNGASVTPFGNPTSGSSHVFEISDTNSDNWWKVFIDGTDHSSSCNFFNSANSYTVRTGYEVALDDSNPVTTNDHNAYYTYNGGIWKLWQGTPVGGHSSSSTTTGFFVKYCGTGSEQFYHHKHGKGTAPASC